MVDTGIQMVARQAERDGVGLSNVSAIDVGTIPSNEQRLRQIVLNLLSNAIKFTPSGGQVGVKTSHDRETGEIVIAVTDSGIGIRSEGIDTALMPFGQIESSLSRRFEGTGLGLPLARSFVEKPGGPLVIESSVGVGTIVAVRLPVEPLSNA